MDADTTKVMQEAKESSFRGITFGNPVLDLPKMRAWKDGIIEKLSGGVKSLAGMRKVEVMHGRGYFEDSNMLRVETAEGQKFVQFDKAIVAVG